MIIGIDLGTTNSVASCIKDGKAVVICNKEGKNTTPSVVSFYQNGKILTGEEAKDKKVENSLDTIWSVKRFMGLKYHELKNEDRDLPYKISRYNEDEIVIETSYGEKFTPVKISAEILSKIKNDCEERLNCSIDQAVITVPAYFSDNQREATRNAGKLAGLEVLSIISEPTAAALAYNVDLKKDQTIAVYDLGGGTFDISILKFENGVCRVLSTNGDTHLGGDDIDRRICDFFISNAAIRTGRNLKEELESLRTREDAKMTIQLFRHFAEQGKIALCTGKSEYKASVANFSGSEPLELKLTKENFDKICRYVSDKTMVCCQNALNDAKLNKGEIDKVLLVGGSTKSPFIRAEVEKFFNLMPDTSINPDEAVSLGAAIQGAILEGEIKHLKLADVTPMTLGIWAKGNTFIPLVKRNSTIPCSVERVFTNATDSGNLNFPICQGENPNVTKNTTVGLISVTGIKEKIGDARIRIKFSIDENGIVQVDATNEKDGSTQSIRLHRKAV